MVELAMKRHGMTSNFKDSLRTYNEIRLTCIAQQFLKINLFPTREQMPRPSQAHPTAGTVQHELHSHLQANKYHFGANPGTGLGRPRERAHPARPAGGARTRGPPGEPSPRPQPHRERRGGPSQAPTARRHPPPSPAAPSAAAATSAAARAHAHSAGGGVTRRDSPPFLLGHGGRCSSPFPEHAGNCRPPPGAHW